MCYSDGDAAPNVVIRREAAAIIVTVTILSFTYNILYYYILHYIILYYTFSAGFKSLRPTGVRLLMSQALSKKKIYIYIKKFKKKLIQQLKKIKKKKKIKNK